MKFLKNPNGINRIRFFEILALAVGCLIIIPIVTIVIYTFSQEYFVLPPAFSYYLTSTLKLVFYTCSISIILAVLPAWVMSFYEIRFKSLLDTLLILPLSIPSYIMAYTYSDIFGYGGVFDIFFQSYLNSSLTIDVLEIHWLSFFLALSLFPYVYTTARISFNIIANSYLNLSQSLTLSKFKTFFKIILPLSISGIFAGTLLVIMEVLNEYGAVKYFGIKTFSVGIFKYWFSMNDKSSAIVLSFILLVVVIFLVILSNFIKNNHQKIKLHTKTVPFYYSLKKKHFLKKILIFVLLTFPITFGLIIPLSFILKNVIINFYNYDWNELLKVLTNTLTLALASSIIITIISFFILSIKRYNNSISLKMITNFLCSGYAIPGAVIGLSVMLLFQQTSLNLNFLMGTITILIYAYIFRFIAVSIFPLESNYKQLPLRFDELGKSLNLSLREIFTKINLPLSMKAIMYSFLIVFIDVIKELPLTLILRPFNFETLATQAYQYANEEMLAYSSIYSMCIILLCSFLIIISNFFLKNKKNVPRY